ncbi:hypothetical protein L1987_38022 [Smallanthus sonchifolius]|uniref:Uncharacterized protein n=1 Tax=Smallanthus sonchifolius TaxID=185202 RepID=A0ACB9HJE4_9ASTR|nr:hypothetical protein L1987_38022 [Smallanthus sonchifolius]
MSKLRFPASLTTLHRLKTIVLSSNLLSGEVPDSVQRLYTLYLGDNRFTGNVPPLNQSGLKNLNLSNNQICINVKFVKEPLISNVIVVEQVFGDGVSNSLILLKGFLSACK